MEQLIETVTNLLYFFFVAAGMLCIGLFMFLLYDESKVTREKRDDEERP
jgi:hypothetical protein